MDKKASSDDDLIKFVNLVEEHKIILSKSQFLAIKSQKRLAIAEMISKWAEISGQNLTEQTLLKKLHNMKARANVAADKNVLTDWQVKLRELIAGSDAPKNVPDKSINSRSNDECRSTLKKNLVSCDVGPRKRTAEDVLNEWETEDTKCLSDEELQRYVLLKHLKLVNLKIEQHETAPVAVEIIELTNEEEM
ncbi:uncharacterized protein LOC119067555 [Bradysia coprophila]|uniref:uncharacterized protein LOC119067555 n=1 Tax=Bradysia coprophila TaxID=38358 RepID=UPI00187D9359|nr:uncharacterized protein LOC119067555 [Bradysia coprophila]